LVHAQPTPDDLLAPFRWRNIGPANMMGRISCLDGYDADWRVQLIGAASGGVWKTTNGGVTFTPIFDRYGSQSIGDVAFFQPDTSIIWVGTGEATNRNSVGWGDGVYKSSDGGKTFQHMGLRETYQIAEIAPHPTDSNTVYVAALGHLFAHTGDRGLFKTTDGGQTWQKLTNGLPDDGKTGATVVVIHPKNPEIVFVGMYERLREPHNMHSGGANGGLFQSTDGGQSWRKLTNGLPIGDTGQIDLDIYLKNPDVMMAYVEADENLPEGVPGGGIYRSDDGGASWTFLLKHFSRPYYHGRIRIHPADDSLIYVVSRDFQYSTDGGKTYERGHPWSTDGGDDHDLWISPQNGDVMLLATDQGARITIDGGKSALSFNNMAIGQYYAIGVDQRDPYWVYGGLQDNGGWAIPSNSRDRAGILTDHVTVINGGDGFHMQVDPTDWRTVFTTTHVGYFGRLNRATGEHGFITPRPHTIVNFDAVYDPDFDETPIDYTINPGDYWTWGSPSDPSINGSALPPQFRYNWNAPLVLSPSNPRTIYVGGNYLFKSVDQGKFWRIISPDLTKNDPATRNSMNSGGLTKDVTGAENHHTIYTIDESPLNPGVVWAGTDDGNVQLTRDGGTTWTNVSAAIPGMPDGIWVSRVEASKFDEATAYVTLDGHWIGDTNPYVYQTTDFGATWTDIAGDIPRETPGNSVYTIVED
ncbi:MAG: WD40/YVTN/BNR-like repeat-containing protein, partial [Rhodothermales bacterium]